MTIADLKKYNNIWIYGASKAGRKIFNILSFFDVNVQGIAVSRYDGTCCMECRVVDISEVKTSHDDTLFIIASQKKYHADIIKTLNDKGYNNYVEWNAAHLNELWRCADYDFEDRRNNGDKCCFILAGYKDFLWEDVFFRIERYIPSDIDVCIISSGLYDKRLSEKARVNNWSYLATKINSVTIVQNVAMALFEDYTWVYKIDEDMFVTENAFEHLMNTYIDVEDNSGYQVGIATPLIPVNGYGYRIILQELGLLEDYIKQFGKAVIGGNPDSEIEKNPETAIFMWDKTMQLDELNRRFQNNDNYSVCGVRFSIGFILMKHSFWNEMQGFYVTGNPDMGSDEEEVCSKCIINSKAIIVAENVVVGHFSFGRQTERMKEYYRNNREWFSMK